MMVTKGDQKTLKIGRKIYFIFKQHTLNLNEEFHGDASNCANL